MATEGLQLVRRLRRAFSTLLLVDGGRDRASAEAAFKRAGADLVALATPFIANPDLVERLSRGWPLAVPDAADFLRGRLSGVHRLLDLPAPRGPSRVPSPGWAPWTSLGRSPAPTLIELHPGHSSTSRSRPAGRNSSRTFPLGSPSQGRL